MKQLLQSVRTGEVSLADVPPPQLAPGSVLVRNRASVLSAGTERKLAEFGGKNLLQKAAARPDLVRQVMDKARREGVGSALDAVQSRLNEPAPLGYSSAGVVLEVGEGVSDIRPGERVACAGYGHACHAEAVCVPQLLVAKIPARRHGPAGAEVSFEEAAFTTLGAIALHGIRTADVKLGDAVAVLGLGTVGQLTVQLLHAAGCRVLAFDPDRSRAALAQQLGAELSATSTADFKSLCAAACGPGVDAVVITADTASNEPVQLAGELTRDRAVVVAVGAVGLTIPRKLYYEKELDFRISRSYGPGRYDPEYEEKGLSYPVGYVPWTQTRNMEAFLKLLADGKLDVQALITHRFPIGDGVRAYELIGGRSGQSYLGVVLTYPGDSQLQPKVELGTARLPAAGNEPATVRVGVLGAGSFANRILLPAIKGSERAQLVAICSRSGVTAQNSARKFGFAYATSSEAQVLADDNIDAVVIATPHHLHARQVIGALRAGKHVFCEKPLCLSEEELIGILATWQKAPSRLLTAGYNRRFSPMARALKEFLAGSSEPMMMCYRVNAGLIPRQHWIQDPERGGGRTIGEVCHFVDFMTYIAGALPVKVWSQVLPNGAKYSDDNVAATLQFSNGCIGSVLYSANGDKSLAKERFEVFTGGRAAVLDDFRRLELRQSGRVKFHRSLLRQDKGHRNGWRAFCEAIVNHQPGPISIAEIATTSLATFAAIKSARSGEPVALDWGRYMAPERAEQRQQIAASS
ncbi:MAG TPA: bi-domain-containing oxidoreductase [Terriglobales bacterium]|nr:bi-domain-containing oxidoreductase [Terriglobales bacterium]